ncbi:DUF4279 domain-containing protein [Pelagibius sp. Alg239-R121]|uniref:DUF4279 domain-containing protein n=1 Tax=Pelagibius sp. Alg239-R121 TaxID=2993448 RepID=UPI0024A6964A|nr:DUF4279 domain-containing protein [Pelagibius sp. Alg239-R121]
MPLTPQTDHQYAQFVALGMRDPEEITQLLGIEPYESWKVGDTFERRGHKLKRRSSMWCVTSGYDDTHSLEDHIEALLRRLGPHRNALLDIGTRYDMQISCVSYSYQSYDFELPFDLQRDATELGIRFRFASYDYGDQHEEIVELREQLNIRGEG